MCTLDLDTAVTYESGADVCAGISAATSAAAVGGVTTLFEMPLNSNPPTTDLTSLKAKQALVKVS